LQRDEFGEVVHAYRLQASGFRFPELPSTATGLVPDLPPSF
jgi:hypothetical protein